MQSSFHFAAESHFALWFYSLISIRLYRSFGFLYFNVRETLMQDIQRETRVLHVDAEWICALTTFDRLVSTMVRCAKNLHFLVCSYPDLS